MKEDSHKTKFFRIMYLKLIHDSEIMAYYLQPYDTCKTYCSDEMDYIKLGMCRYTTDKKRLKKISDYVKISVKDILKMITKKCDGCGKEFTGKHYSIANENFVVQKGLIQCGECMKLIVNPDDNLQDVLEPGITIEKIREKAWDRNDKGSKKDR